MTTHEEDIAKFSSPDEEACQKRRPGDPFRAFGSFKLTPPLNREHDGAVSTGLPRLDAALALRSGLRPSALGPGRNSGHIQNHQGASTRGIMRGELTEVMGPRGVGKTAFAMGIAANFLQVSQKVIWIDTAGPMNPTRFKDILQRERNAPFSDDSPPAMSNQINVDEFLNQLFYFHPPTLAHLLALISHPPKGFPPQGTGLIVIDSISSLFASEYRTKLPPRNRTPKLTRTTESKDERTRWKIIGNLVMNLKKLAARLNCAVIVINEMASRFRDKQPPVLHEALSGITWDSGVTTRILLCWHWLPPSFRSRVRMKRVRFAEVVKAERVGLVHGRTLRIVPFVIQKTGLHEFTPGPCGTPLSISIRASNHTNLVHMRSKRKLDHVLAGSFYTRRKPRIEPASTPEVKIETSDQDEGIGGTTPPKSSLVSLTKEEEGEEYGWVDEDGTEFVDEVVNEEGPGSEVLVFRDDGNIDGGSCLNHAVEGDIENDTVLLLRNISDDDEFD